MALFKIGDKVLTADTNVHGTIVKVMPARRGRQLYTVNLPNYINGYFYIASKSAVYN